MASYDESDGVWRTVGGRRIFIKDGQSLGDAMKASGKFKKASKVKRSEYQTEQAKLDKERADQKLKDLTEEHPEAEDTKGLEGKHIKEKNKKHAFEKEPEDKEQEEDLYQEFKEKGAIGQSYSEYKAQKETGKTYKLDTTKLDGEYHNLPERTSEEQASDERYANAKAMYKLTGDEKYKKAYQEEIEKSTERIRQKVEAEKGSSKTYAPEDLEQGKPYEIDMGNGIKKTAIYMGKDEEGNSSFYDGEGVEGTFGFSDKFMKENIKISDNKDDDKFIELHNQIKKETSEKPKTYQEYYGLKDNRNEMTVKEYEDGNIDQQELKDMLRRGGESEDTIHKIVKANTGANSRDERIRNLFNDTEKEKAEYARGKAEEYKNTKDPMFQDVKEERAKGYEKQAKEAEAKIKDNPYATNNKGGSDDNSSKFAREARDYWDNKNLDYKASHDGKEDEMAVNFRDRWDKELKNREYGEKKAKESNKVKFNESLSKTDYEHDLKWFEDMEKSHPTKGGLKNNEDYQTLKAQYESEFKTKWNSGTEAKETPKYRWKDIDGKTIEPGDYKRVGGGSLVKQNEDGTSVHIATTRKGDGSLEYTRYDHDANGEAGKGKTYKSLEEAKVGKTGNEAMNDKIKTGASRTRKSAYQLDQELRAKEDKYLSSSKPASEKTKQAEEIKKLHDKVKAQAEKEGQDTTKTNWRDDLKESKNNNVSDSIKRKAYEKYLKEHPNSKMKYEDFIK